MLIRSTTGTVHTLHKRGLFWESGHEGVGRAWANETHYREGREPAWVPGQRPIKGMSTYYGGRQRTTQDFADEVSYAFTIAHLGDRHTRQVQEARYENLPEQVPQQYHGQGAGSSRHGGHAPAHPVWGDATAFGVGTNERIIRPLAENQRVHYQQEDRQPEYHQPAHLQPEHEPGYDVAANLPPVNYQPRPGTPVLPDNVSYLEFSNLWSLCIF